MKLKPTEIEDVEMPEVSYGECQTESHRPIIIAELANGFCMECWDRGRGAPKSSHHMRKNKRGYHQRLGKE